MSMNRRFWCGILLTLTILMISSDWLLQPAAAYNFPCGVDLGQRLVFRSYTKANETAQAVECYIGYEITSFLDDNFTIWGGMEFFTDIHGKQYEMTVSAYAASPDQMFTEASLHGSATVGRLFDFLVMLDPCIIRSDKKVSELENRYEEQFGYPDFTVTPTNDGFGVHIVSTPPGLDDAELDFVYTCNGVLDSMEIRSERGFVNILELVSGDKWCPDYSPLIIMAIVVGVAVAACALNAAIKRLKGRKSPKPKPKPILAEPAPTPRAPAPPAPLES